MNGEDAVESSLDMGKGIWVRSRTNALANKHAAQKVKTMHSIVYVLQVVLILFPIFASSMTLWIIQSESHRVIALIGSQTGVISEQERQVISAVQENEGKTKITTKLQNELILVLGLFTILSNVLALFIAFLMSQFKWTEKYMHHEYMHSGYQLISQKSRRLENANLPQQEGKHLCRHLEESMEVYKAMGNEPSSKCFEVAKKNIKRFNKLPFGLSANDF